MKVDRGKGKVDVIMKFFVNFWYIGYYRNLKRNNFWILYVIL